MSESPTSANPYESPPTVDLVPVTSYVVQLTPGSNTILPRHLAASADLMAAFVLSVVAYKLLPEDSPLLQCTAVIAIWIGYYFLSEWLFSATPGKWLAGLTVKTVDGDRIRWRQVGIRTLLRIVEVNPFVVGAVPAAICILVTERRQRIGDKLAGTVVVRRKRSR